MNKKMLVTMLVMCLISATTIINADAKSAHYSLRYIVGAPTSEDITSWTKTVKTEYQFTSATVESITSGCAVKLYSSNGIEAVKSTTSGSVMSGKTKPGATITIKASFAGHGTAATQKITGDFVY